METCTVLIQSFSRYPAELWFREIKSGGRDFVLDSGGAQGVFWCWLHRRERSSLSQVSPVEKRDIAALLESDNISTAAWTKVTGIVGGVGHGGHRRTYTAVHLPWGWEVGAGNDVTPEPTPLQHDKSESHLAIPVPARIIVSHCWQYQFCAYKHRSNSSTDGSWTKLRL